MRLAGSFALVFPILAAGGCSSSPGDGTSDGSGSSTDASSLTAPTGSTTIGMTTTASSLSAGTVGVDGTSSGSSSTTEDPVNCGVPPYIACDPLDAEFCPEGQVCTFDYHPKGGGWACGCDYGDQGPFEECETTIDPGDDCAPAQVCLATSSEGPQLCQPLCGSPLCSKSSICQDDLCAVPCDPFEPSGCPGAMYCGPGDQRFVCLNSSAFPAEPMGLGEPCTGPGGCEHGLLCRPGSTVSGCAEDSCCAAVCDEAEMQGCDAGESCTPIIENPMGGSETLGVCTPA